MIVSFAIWSPLISLLAISLLYPLKLHHQGQQAGRIYATLFTLPAAVSSFYLLLITLNGSTIATKFITIPFIQISIALNISLATSIINLSIVLAMAALVFITAESKYPETISIYALVFSAIYLISSLNDPLMRLAILSASSFILPSVMSAKNIQQNKPTELSSLIFCRLADFIAIYALLLMLSKPGSSVQKIPEIAYVMSTSFQVIFLIAIFTYTTFAVFYHSDTYRNGDSKSFVLQKIFIAISAQLLLFNFPRTIPQDKHIKTIFIGLTLLIFTISLLCHAVSKTKTRFVFLDLCLNIMIMGALLTLITKIHSLTVVFISGLIFLCPFVLAALDSSFFSTPLTFAFSEPLQRFSLVFKILTRGVLAGTRTVAKVFIALINPLYSGFFFYHLPKIILSIPQFVLRFFNNGDIHRSIIFVVAVLIAYSFWWQKL